MSIHEECGVFGAFSKENEDLSSLIYYGLYALQHRGQESAGIVINDDGIFYSHKDIGLVGEVFSKEVLSSFPKGQIGVGHVRYGTTGLSTRINCQPIEVNHQKGKLSLAHNGNLSNAYALRNELELTGAIFHTTSDTEIIAYIITKERLSAPSIEKAISNAMNKLEGAYSLVLMSSTKLIAVRDPFGFRPLCYGKTKNGSYIVASESSALNSVGAEFIRDVMPGEIIVFNQDGVTSYTEYCNMNLRKTCIFEYIYFARPDSVIDGISIQNSRIKAGELLAQKYPVDADIVIGVPDSGLDAALGYAKQSNIPYGIGLIKNKYIGRTFISPSNNTRVDQLKIKLNPVSSLIKGKKVVLVDDSIVRGTTSKRIVKLLKEAGAKEIHMRISAPPFLFPCYYGTDIDSKENLIACHHNEKEIAQIIGVDTLGYLPLEDLPKLINSHKFCSSCFDGNYPTKIPKNNQKNRFEQKLSEKRNEG